MKTRTYWQTACAVILGIVLLISPLAIAADSVKTAAEKHFADSLADIHYSLAEIVTPSSLKIVSLFVEVDEESFNDIFAAVADAAVTLSEDDADRVYASFMNVDGVIWQTFEVSISDGEETVTAFKAKPKMDASNNSNEPEVKEVKVGETFKTDDFEFTLNKVQIVHEVYPPDISGYYTYYTDEPGKVYVHVDMTVKNLRKGAVGCDDIYSALLVYSKNMYEYRGQLLVLRDRSNFSYPSIRSIDPLQSEYVGVMFDVPDEVETSRDHLSVIFKVGNESFVHVIRP